MEGMKILDSILVNILSYNCDPIFIKDKDSRFIFVNNEWCKMIGYEKEEILGRTFVEHLFEDQREQFLEMDRDVLSFKKEFIQDSSLVTKDGRLMSVIIKKNYYVDDSGEPLIVCIVHDVTEIKKVQDELSKINQEKDKFFSIIAHDLRNPFLSFLGLTQLMTEDLHKMTLDQIKILTTSMKDSAVNIYNLLENLLQWSMVRRNLMIADIEIIELKPRIEDVLNMISSLADDKWIEIIFDIPEGLYVYADSNMLKSIIINLFSNAVKFTHKRGSIKISAVKVDSTIEISVEDTGIGMDQKMIDNLFQLEFSTNRKGTEGELTTGLGLILCRDFVKKNNGRLWVTSEVNKGTKFSFTLPNF